MIYLGFDSQQALRMHPQTVLATAAATNLCCRKSNFYVIHFIHRDKATDFILISQEKLKKKRQKSLNCN
jgi:hypothetical protein